MAISPMKAAMLQALAQYKYLTPGHILQLGISRSLDKTRKYFSELRNDRKFTGRQVHYALGPNAATQQAQRVRHPDLHYLTAKGARFLRNQMKEEQVIHVPKKPKEYLSNDYLHRVSTISVHIAYDQRLKKYNGRASRFLTYYQQQVDSQAGRRVCATRIERPAKHYFSPDAIAVGEHVHGVTYLRCIEIYNGDRVQYATKQLGILVKMIEESEVIEDKMGVTVIPRILCICESEWLMKKIQERVGKQAVFHVEYSEELIWFKVSEAVRKEFGTQWENKNGVKKNLNELKRIVVE